MDAYDSLFDDNNEKERLEKRLEKFYGQFSTRTRQKLLSKNLVVPTSVYDVLYPQTRTDLLSKNTEIASDLSEDSKSIRDKLLTSFVTDEINLEKQAEDLRKAQLAKNKLTSPNIFANSEIIRDNNLTKNTPNSSDLEKDSEQFRNGDIHKNVEKKSDLLASSAKYREYFLARNKPDSKGPEENNEQFRIDDLSKNVKKESDLLSDSEQYRIGDVHKNINKESNLLSDSEQYRIGDVHKNVSKELNLEKDSKKFRDDDLFKNTSNGIDLETDSESFRDDDLSLNAQNSTDLETDSAPFRDDDLSLNAPSGTDLETDSESFRGDDLSLNTPNNTDLETDSESFRDDDLSLNTPSSTDLETDSAPFRDDDLSLNTPNSTDLETDSAPFRDDDLSENVSNGTDLETDSEPFRDDDLSVNVSNGTDLETDSEPFRDDDLSANVPNSNDLETDSESFRDDDLSANVSNGADLETDSEPFRDDDLSANVSDGSDLEVDSEPFRDDDLSLNITSEDDLLLGSKDFRKDNLIATIPKQSNLLFDSKQFKDDALSKNNFGGLFGVNVNAVGTSKFLGVSRVLTQGILFRKILERRNKPKNLSLELDSEAIREINVGKNNKYQLANNQYNESTSPNLLQISSDFYADSIFKAAIPMAGGGTSERLQNAYGITPNSLTRQNVDFRLGEGPESILLEMSFLEGSVTSNIREFNLSRNINNTKGIIPGSSVGHKFLAGFPGPATITQTSAGGFQELISKTIGSLKKDRVSMQRITNTTPTGNYLGDNQNFPEEAVRIDPGEKGLGGGLSMAGKDIAGNPFYDPEFELGAKGVRHIVNTIKDTSPDLIEFAQNFDVQNEQVYIIGRERGEQRKSRQRFTMANPYAPAGAAKLVFSIRNYSIPAATPENPQTMFFPPYITSFTHGETANWNSTSFLGRSEPLYTYNNSTRDGSITFMVLTDYAQSVDIGRNYKDETADDFKNKKSVDFKDIHWTDFGKPGIENDKKAISEIKVKIQDVQAKINEAKDTNKAELKKDLANLNIQKSRLETKDGVKQTKKNNPNYSESSKDGKNVYNDISNNSGRDGGNLVGQLTDTTERLNQMKKGLKFQPAFFSGDDFDFIKRIEFIAKTTKPRRNESAGGFSFNIPPVCHIHLGTWINHDVVINSVSFDYSDAPWNFVGDNSQPMWATVTMSFNIIGAYKHGKSPMASSDIGGYFGTPRKNVT